MPANYRVAAQVIDIRADQPRATDCFLVDTNVWFWLTYTGASSSPTPPSPYQLQNYPGYVKKARAAGVKLRRCSLSLPELAHRIERTELAVYERANPTLRPSASSPATGWMSIKDYRHNLAAERTRVITEVEAAWGQVTTMADPVDVLIDESVTESALKRFSTQHLDGYDLFIVEAAARAGIVQVLTDDGDYSGVQGIQVFTANDRVVAAARQQGRLVRR